MPGTTRYSATFERTYEEEPPAAAPPATRRSRSQSWQADTITNGRSVGPLFANAPVAQHARSSSTENGSSNADLIPTRGAGNGGGKAHNNPFQFVKVASCPLSRKAEEQLKKSQQIKKPAVVKEEEEDEWQSNLDSWKSRRRKMSEGAFMRQEELRKLEMEEQFNACQQMQKKTKTFSEMVEQRQHRGRAVSLCLFSSPLESSEWIFENTKSQNRVLDFHSEESAESSNINSDDENYNKQDFSTNNNGNTIAANELTNGQNGVQNSTSNSSISKSSDLSELDVSQESINLKDEPHHSLPGFVDSGLESLSSSHRTGDVPDSGSDFSQDSGSSIDCDSPRASGLITTGIELLEEFSSKEEPVTDAAPSNSTSKFVAKTSNGVSKSAVVNGKKILNGTSENSKNIIKDKPTPKMNKNSPNVSKSKVSECNKPSKASKVKASKLTNEKSIESENEMFVDDFEELARLKNAEATQQSSSNSTKQGLKPCNGNSSSVSDKNFNVIYQSMPSKHQSVQNSKKTVQENKADKFSLISEVPVEKVTEEMERLILEQLEAEEQTKEVLNNVSIGSSSNDQNDLELTNRKVKPPKEKPPPPPKASPEAPKDQSVKRVNSTKRILKEINKRRSDFLGIDNSKQEKSAQEVPMVLPPPPLEDFLREEHKLDRQHCQMLESCRTAIVEEDELAKQEREIIEKVEAQERVKYAEEQNHAVPDFTNAHIEESKIKELKEERQRIADEINQAEEQKKRLEEAALLQKREELIREQEAANTSEASLALSPSDAPATNSNKAEIPSSVSAQKGDGQNSPVSLAAAPSLSCSTTSSSCINPSEDEVPNVNKEAPATPKPPKKKKEAIRKERERLRQEQEALQREREEHRLKVQLENEQLMKKSLSNFHVVEAPASQVGPLPLAKPASPPKVLTSSISSSSSSSSSTTSSREMPKPRPLPPHADPKNSISGISPAGQSKTKRCALPPHSKASNGEFWNQQKLIGSRKQELPAETRYNQNHWLIQEAEMRRIAELKEKQSLQNRPPPPPFHLAQFPEEYSDPAHRYAQNGNLRSPEYPVPPQKGSSEYYGQKQQQPQQQQVNVVKPSKKCVPHPVQQNMDTSRYLATYSKHFEPNLPPPPNKPTRVAPFERQEQMLSVSGKKRCSHCGVELGRGAAMIIESLQLYYHMHCFSCCVCQAQLGNGLCGTDVRVRNNKLHCHNCYSNDEAGLKFSQV